MPETTLAVLRRELERLRPVWADFHEASRNRALLRHRRSGQRFTSQMPGLEHQIDIESAYLEAQFFHWLSTFKINLSMVDVLSLDTGTKAERIVEDIRIWDAHTLARMNDGRVLDDAIYSGLVVDGVSWLFQGWLMPPEPDEAELKTGIEEGDSDEARQRKRNQAREKFYEQWLQEHDPFPWSPVSSTEMMHWPLSKPKVFIQESEIDLYDAGRIRNDKDEHPALDREGNLFWMGDTQPTGEWRDETQGATDKLDFVRMAREVDGVWWVSEWVKGGKQKDDDFEKVKEYRAPFKHPPYIVVPGGFTDYTETSNPLWRYRPALASLYVDIEEYNSLRTLWAELTVLQITKRGYVSLTGVRPEVVQMFQNSADSGVGRVVGEGQGAEKRWVLDEPDATSDELALAPGRVEPWPLIEKMLEFVSVWLQEVKTNIERDSLNRFLTGEALPEAASATGSVSLQQAQAAQTPLLPFITAADHAKETLLEMRHQAIQYWDEDADGEVIDARPFSYRTRGDEPVAMGEVDRGRVVAIDANKLSHPHTVVVHTEASTQQERIMEEEQAVFKWEKGLIDRDQLLRLTGSPDPKVTKEKIWRDQREAEVDAQYALLYQETIRTLIAAATEVMPPPPPQMTQMQSGQQGNGQPMEPPGIGIHNGTSPAVGSPGQQSTTGMVA